MVYTTLGLAGEEAEMVYTTLGLAGEEAEIK